MPLDNWKLSFPSQMLPDVIAWASDHLPARCPKATEEEILSVFGVLYSLTRTSETRRDLWSTKDGLFSAPHFGERYGLSRDHFEIIFRFALHLRPQATSGPQSDVLLMVLMKENTENISGVAALC